MTHPTWELPVENGATLVLTPCPGTKGVSLSDSIKQLKEQGVTIIVTALSLDEMQEAGVATLPQEVEKAGLLWLNAPIEDDCAPDDAFLETFQAGLPALLNAVDKGEKIALHCMGGSGRTGLLAAHLLLEKGWELTDIIEKVKTLRPGAFTKAVQIDYIHQFAN